MWQATISIQAMSYNLIGPVHAVFRKCAVESMVSVQLILENNATVSVQIAMCING